MSTAPEAITVVVKVHPDALRMLNLQAEMLECANRLKADGVLPPELGECLLNFCPVFFGAIRVLLDSPGVVSAEVGAPSGPLAPDQGTFIQELQRIAEKFPESAGSGEETSSPESDRKRLERAVTKAGVSLNQIANPQGYAITILYHPLGSLKEVG